MDGASQVIYMSHDAEWFMCGHRISEITLCGLHDTASAMKFTGQEKPFAYIRIDFILKIKALAILI